jgi:hypothetical protein
MEENDMKKLGYVIAALSAIAIAAPSIASAETVVIKRGDRDNYGARAEFREHRDHGWREGWGWRHRHRDIYGARAEFREHRDRGWHEGWGWRHRHHDKVVIIKNRHHEY